MSKVRKHVRCCESLLLAYKQTQCNSKYFAVIVNEIFKSGHRSINARLVSNESNIKGIKISMGNLLIAVCRPSVDL